MKRASDATENETLDEEVHVHKIECKAYRYFIDYYYYTVL